ncbi:uncharacterized protein AMSG_10512 [Thecamonas trahens ATCC 50062]|uniref:Uncharacterized protein n=1 Tax=Thecamonas trahens ATCC 50062 TaxID=461836 RepID=A0A0L0DSS7_THETB|nr:hypothetical protein AMSG_10512 [Thecamonas trahens ATCC 50062]KNC54513.1 hypothetical protein AMSG_10512 [Thecamonas trahens ATCC 50062]|eukprot:XP_013753666.1 hypothetical protein AMSG_10512 [Thecamonas trahens ATCC 50062]
MDPLSLSNLDSPGAGAAGGQKAGGRGEAVAGGQLAASVAAIAADVRMQSASVNDELARVKGEVQARFDLLTAMIADVAASAPHSASMPLQSPAATASPPTHHPRIRDDVRRVAQVEGALAVFQTEVLEVLAASQAEVEGLVAKMAGIEARVGSEEELVRAAEAFVAADGEAVARAVREASSATAATDARVDRLAAKCEELYTGFRVLESNAVAKFAETDDEVADLGSQLRSLREHVDAAVGDSHAAIRVELDAERAARRNLETLVASLRDELYSARASFESLASQVGALADSAAFAESSVTRAELDSALAGLRAEAKPAEAALSELAAIRASIDELTTRVSRNTHVSVANDIAFRALKDKLGGVVGVFEAQLARDYEDDVVVGAEIDKFLASVKRS